MRFKEILIYSLIVLVLIVVLSLVQFNIFYMSNRNDVILVVAVIILMAAGAYFGQLFIKRKSAKTFEVNKAKNQNLLSKRELEVLHLLSLGHSNQEIADKLFVSITTIKTHTSNIYQKLDVKRRTQAVQKGLDLGLISSPT
jgi:DNA-binding NarL/FixJ family response regulator